MFEFTDPLVAFEGEFNVDGNTCTLGGGTDNICSHGAGKINE